MITKRRSTPETNADQSASLITSNLAQDIFTPGKRIQIPEFGKFFLNMCTCRIIRPVHVISVAVIMAVV